MLKITVLDSGLERRVMVEGKLTEPSVSELEAAWNQARQAGGSRPIVVDLRGVTAIDLKGEAALETMIAEGAHLAVKGLYCEYVVGQLINRARRKRMHGRHHCGDPPDDSSSTEKSRQRAGRQRSQDSGGPRSAEEERQRNEN